MSIFSFFRSQPKSSAVHAKERLQIVMAHERVGRTGPDYLPMLQQELLAVIAKYIDIDQNKVEVKLDRGGDCSTLEVNIELPAPDQLKPRMGGASAAKPANGDGANGGEDEDEGGKDQMTAASARSMFSGALTNGGIKKRR